ncbi:hypothetical protein [Pseudomonas agarici]|uniref:hypothetical protein n=1 Tax=Pseudomonas agarici TaxID=46677 RepID=UPI0008D87325|nr:hypothetical protein [Pseudomonas agarici]NWB92261.1 hypothetical protein [Pseudomonas agarici]NWC07507.1 hypothetical protein [Pseudomonas agarici]SEK42124.1 hypothetical protein SAMN05216604_10319 [Pseudomonas agarici]
MSNSTAKKILGSVFLLLSLLCALPASAAIVGCTGTLGAVISPGLSPSPASQTISAQGSVVSVAGCAIVGTSIQPASLTITTSFSGASCTGFTLATPPVMTITWDDNTTGTATYVSTSPSFFPLPFGPFGAQFKIVSGPHEVNHTMSITASPPLSLALLGCALLGSRKVTHLGAPILFTVN